MRASSGRAVRGSQATTLDFRSAAAMPEFTPLEALQVGKKASTAAGMKTVFAAESSLNIARRIRNAAVPLGCVVEDDAAVRDAARRAFFRGERRCSEGEIIEIEMDFDIF